MAKKKGAKALFEVINDRSKSKPPGGPGWFGRARAAFSQARAQADPSRQDALAAQAAAPPPPASGAVGSDEPMVSVQDGRVRISLNQVSAVVAVLGFLLVMAGAFYFGRQVGMGGHKGPAAAALPTLAATDKPGSGNAPGKAGVSAGRDQAVGAAIADEGKRKKGMYYLVVQGGIRDQQDAKGIIEYLADNDIPASPVRDATNKWKVLADKPFSRQDSKDLQDYKSRIGSLGKDYMRKHGYDFRDCYTQLEK